MTKALEPGLRTRGFIFNTLLADKATDDRLRSFPSWLSSRNLSNEASDESVQALVEAVKSAYELPQRWYRLKARLLGLDKLADYDRMAVVGDDDTEIGWEEGRGIVLDTFGEVAPQRGDTEHSATIGNDVVPLASRPGMEDFRIGQPSGFFESTNRSALLRRSGIAIGSHHDANGGTRIPLGRAEVGQLAVGGGF